MSDVGGCEELAAGRVRSEDGLISIPTSANLCSTLIGSKPEYQAGKVCLGGRNIAVHRAGRATTSGETAAWNVDTGKKMWCHDFAKSTDWGGLFDDPPAAIFGGGHAGPDVPGRLTPRPGSSCGRCRPIQA